MAPAHGDTDLPRLGLLLLSESSSAGTKPITFFGGKGGVGKTTLAVAYATLLASGGQRTLLVSTDPAHSTGDLLGANLSGEPAQTSENLWAVEVDAQADAEAYVERVKTDARDSVSPEVLPTVDKHLELAKSSPGTEESALFDRFVDLISLHPASYERIVFDTAPTGHTLRLLTLPALLSTWVEGVVRQREKVAGMERMLRNMAGSDERGDDPILNRLRERRERFHHARHRLLEDTAFNLVLIPERLPIEETARSIETLTANGIQIGALLVNRVLPDEAGGEFMRARLAQQAEYLSEISSRFPDRDTVYVEQDARDVTEEAQISAIARSLEKSGLGG